MATESTTAQDLSIQVTDSEGGALVGLGGRVTIDSSPDLRKQLLALLSRRSLPTLIIDLLELSYIDCSGIATLIEALRIAHQRHTKLQLRGVRGGRLERPEEVDYEGGVRVEVGLSAQMADLRSGKTVWTNAASESAPVDKRTVTAVVAEMSQAMDRAIEKLVASLTVPTTSSLDTSLQK